MALLLKEIITYLSQNKTIALATVNNENLPDIRTLGGYNFDGLTLYFATSISSNKVEQLASHDHVAVLVQHENQVSPNFLNVTIYGKAVKLSKTEYEIGRQKILERRPSAIYEENSKNIYKVVPELVKIIDLSKNEKDRVTLVKP